AALPSGASDFDPEELRDFKLGETKCLIRILAAIPFPGLRSQAGAATAPWHGGLGDRRYDRACRSRPRCQCIGARFARRAARRVAVAAGTRSCADGSAPLVLVHPGLAERAH